MKLVKFRDGRYGVRKWSIWPLDAVFLDLKGRDYWWSNKVYVDAFAKGTKEQALEAMEKYPIVKREAKLDNRKDNGEIVKG